MPRKLRTEKQIEQFKRFQAKGTLTAIQGQATRLLYEELFTPPSHFRLKAIRKHCTRLLEILEGK